MVERKDSPQDDKEPISRRAILAKTIEATSSVKVDAGTAAEVRALITRSLFAQAPAYLAIEALAAVLAAGIYFYLGASGTMFAWLVLSLAAIIVRWVHVYRYFAKERKGKDAARWARVFAFGALLSGVLWGIGSLLAFSPDNPSLLIVQIFIVTGLGAMALTGYSVHALSFYCFIMFALIPFGVRLMIEGTGVHTFVAVLLSIWTGVFVYLCHLLSNRYFERTLFLAQSDFTAATRQAQDLAEQANRAKTRFLANVSHEFRTPLNAIIGFSDMIRGGYLGDRNNAKYADYIEAIHQSGQHLKQLVDDVLDVSRIEMGRLQLNESLVEVEALLRECERSMRLQFERAKVRLSVAVARDLAAMHGDPLRLRQVVLNLMTNALKFTAAQGEVWVTAGKSDSGELVIHVSDSGVGMRKEDIPRALLPFVQISEPLSQGDHGIGIGLYLVRMLTEAHDGSVMIHSEIGRGTVVTIKFPPKRLLAGHGPAARTDALATANA
jgi:signal transduction histidine kinase